MVEDLDSEDLLTHSLMAVVVLAAVAGSGEAPGGLLIRDSALTTQNRLLVRELTHRSARYNAL